MISNSTEDNISAYLYSWGQIGDEDLGAPLSILYDYGKITLLHQNSEVMVEPLNYGMTTFSCADDIWGISAYWVKDLIAYHKFIFIIQFEALPDVILADNNIIWKRSKNNACNGRVVASYVPNADGPVKLTFLKDKRYQAGSKKKTGIRFGQFTGCAFRGSANPVNYQQYDKADSLTETHVAPLLTNRDYYDAPLFEPNLSPIVEPKYRTMDVDIMHETVEAFLPELTQRISVPKLEHIRNIIDTIPLLEANGISGLVVYHLNDELLEALAKSKLRNFIVATCSAGEWWGPCGSDTHETRHELARGLDNCNRLQDKMDDCHVYFWFPEIDDREHDYFKHPAMKDKFNTWSVSTGIIGYNDFLYNEYWKRDSVASANRQWKKDLWAKINDPARATAIYQAGYQLGIMDFYREGSDMTVCKAIFRSCLNITVAAGRGVHKAYGQRLGFDYDPWSWRFRMNHHPDEWSQGLLVYLHAGCSFLFHEGTLFRRDSDGHIKPNETGQRFIEAARYARRHPELGEQVVKMAAMSGSGFIKECREIFSAQFLEDRTAPDWKDLRCSDYHLLNIFFPGLGGYMSGTYERMMTGTPYGPLDIIPADTESDAMNAYDFIFVMGVNGCTNEQLQAWTSYVKNGGKLVLSLGQLRAQEIEPRAIITSDLRRLAGIEVDPESEEINIVDAQILHTFPEGSMLLHHRLAKGEVYLFTTSTLTAMGEAVPRSIIEKLASESKFIELDPFSDWIEVMVNRKGQTISLSLFNHAQIGFPSGNGKKAGPWSGKISVDLAKLSIHSSCNVKIVEDGCRLAPVNHTIENGILVVNCTIDKFTELVIGPDECLVQDWYGTRAKD